MKIQFGFLVHLAVSPQMHACDGHIDMMPGQQSVWGPRVNLQNIFKYSAVSLLGKI